MRAPGADRPGRSLQAATAATTAAPFARVHCPTSRAPLMPLEGAPSARATLPDVLDVLLRIDEQVDELVHLGIELAERVHEGRRAGMVRRPPGNALHRCDVSLGGADCADQRVWILGPVHRMDDGVNVLVGGDRGDLLVWAAVLAMTPILPLGGPRVTTKDAKMCSAYGQISDRTCRYCVDLLDPATGRCGSGSLTTTLRHV